MAEAGIHCCEERIHHQGAKDAKGHQEKEKGRKQGMSLDVTRKTSLHPIQIALFPPVFLLGVLVVNP